MLNPSFDFFKTYSKFGGGGKVNVLDVNFIGGNYLGGVVQGSMPGYYTNYK